MERRFDRTTENVGNIVKLEHINVKVPDQGLATLFYVTGMGFTRDPFIMTSTNNMWINIGQNQFHLPTGKPDVLRGVNGIVVPDREALLKRLQGVKKQLDGTKFAFAERNDLIEATCPWGNRFRCHEPDRARFGPLALGVPYVQFDVPAGAAPAIARFYEQVMEAPAKVEDEGEGCQARVQVGVKQYFLFRETDKPLPEYDSHHIQIYLADFAKPYRRLAELGLLTMDTLEHEYRFKDIVNLDSKQVVFTVEHEVRSMRHPLFGRPLVNRNPAQTNQNYRPGHDAMSWALA